jgi:ribosomal 30S subunit maturation factor RimM
MKRVAFFMAVLFFVSFGVLTPSVFASTHTAKRSYKTFNARELIGVQVKNLKGTVLGVVNGIMIDREGHAYAIVNHGDYDLFGSGGVDTPVPVAALKISKADFGQTKIILDMDTEHMDFAPYLDPTKIDNIHYDADIYGYFGVRTHWNDSAKGNTVSDCFGVIGASVINPRHDLLGTINEVMIDSEGHAFAVVNHGDFDLIGYTGADTAIPFAALRISTTTTGHEKVILHTDMTQMALAPVMSRMKSPSAKGDARIYAYFKVQPYWSETINWQMPNTMS